MIDPGFNTYPITSKEKPLVKKPRIIEGPKEFEVSCGSCHTKFAYTFPMVQRIKNGTCTTGQKWKTGLDCPSCGTFFKHE